MPGGLAKVTDVLAAAGGNVESIDLHLPSDGVAVDEIGVQASDDWDMVGVAGRIDIVQEVCHGCSSRSTRQGPPGDGSCACSQGQR